MLWKQSAMLKAHFDHLLNVILDSHEGIADLFFVVGRPFQVEAHGKLKPVRGRSAGARS